MEHPRLKVEAGKFGEWRRPGQTESHVLDVYIYMSRGTLEVNILYKVHQ